jgi:hypothetical protein
MIAGSARHAWPALAASTGPPACCAGWRAEHQPMAPESALRLSPRLARRRDNAPRTDYTRKALRGTLASRFHHPWRSSEAQASGDSRTCLG